MRPAFHSKPKLTHAVPCVPRSWVVTILLVNSGFLRKNT